MSIQLLHWILFVSCILPILASDGVKLTELAFESYKTQAEDGFIINIENSDLTLLDGPRYFYTLLTFTSTNPSHECKTCQELQPVIAQVSKSWFADYSESHFLSFVQIDLNDASNHKLFRDLDMFTVPHLWLIPPSMDDVPFDLQNTPFSEFQIPKSSQNQQVMALAQFLGEHLQKIISVRGEDATGKFIKTFIITFSAIIFIKKKGPTFVTSTKKSSVICYLSIAFILLCVGGYQYAVQNRVPFLIKGDNGELILISGGTHYQFAVETLLVDLNYAALASITLLLIKLGNYQINESSLIKSENLRTWLIIINCILIYILYSCFTSIVLRKDAGYPYSLTKLF